jgi:hypothetical protein
VCLNSLLNKQTVLARESAVHGYCSYLKLADHNTGKHIALTADMSQITVAK